MNKTVMFSIAFAAIVAIAITPTLASALTDLAETEVEVENGAFKKVEFNSDSDLLASGIFGGYAIFTEGGDILAATSHAGFYDHPSQGASAPAGSASVYGGPASVCAEGDLTGCGNEWHIHLVQAGVEENACALAYVAALSYDNPSGASIELDTHKKKGFTNKVQINDVAIGSESIIDAASGIPVLFTVGTDVVDPNPVSGETGVAFPLNPVVYDGGVFICIGAPAED